MKAEHRRATHARATAEGVSLEVRNVERGRDGVIKRGIPEPGRKTCLILNSLPKVMPPVPCFENGQRAVCCPKLCAGTSVKSLGRPSWDDPSLIVLSQNINDLHSDFCASVSQRCGAIPLPGGAVTALHRWQVARAPCQPKPSLRRCQNKLAPAASITVVLQLTSRAEGNLKRSAAEQSPPSRKLAGSAAYISRSTSSHVRATAGPESAIVDCARMPEREFES